MNKKNNYLNLFLLKIKFKTLFFVFLVIVFSLFTYFSHPLPSLAQDSGNVIKNLDKTVEKIDYFKSQANENYETYFQTKVGKIVGLALSFVGVIFLILMIYAGILWMTAGGNDSQISKAKDLLTNAAIGLVITLAAYAITNFIGTELLN